VTPASAGVVSTPACALHFLDGTKNGTRRWCDMLICGIRSDAAAYNRHHRGHSDA